MKPGDISEVIRSQGGYQIFKLETLTADEAMTVRRGARATRSPTRVYERSA